MNLKETKEWATKGCANSFTILDLITKIEQLQLENKKIKDGNLRVWSDNRQSNYLIIKLKHQRDELLDTCKGIRAFIRYLPSHPGFAEPCDCGHCEMCKLNEAIATTEE